MCGITGIWSNNGDKNEFEFEIKKMALQQRHRGPNSEGFWKDEDNLFFLAHQRLSIIDLSAAGNQPMVSKSGRYVISFNGEIYNFKELKEILENENHNLKWRGDSDTEIFLEFIDKKGLKKALQKSVGMFALALWDRQNKSLMLARDRMGEKPIYYGFSGPISDRVFLFSSELASIKEYKYFNNSINQIGLSQLLNFQAISAPNSIFQDIYQLLPGHSITLKAPKQEFLPDSEPWYCITEKIQNIDNKIDDFEEAEFEVEKVLKEAVKLQSVADVTLGTFLSGGIDSSLITALLQSQSKNKVKTFTIGFEDQDFNEAPFSREISKYLGTDHTEITLTSNDALKIIPDLSKIYSEPFADSSQLPTHLVCREAKKNGLTVALTGDGGDESFGGYNRYTLGGTLWNKLNSIPWPARKIIGEVGNKIPQEFLTFSLKQLGIKNLTTKFYKLCERLKYIKTDDEFYFSLIALWKNPNFLFNENYINGEIDSFPSSLDSKLPEEFRNDLVSRMMIFDTLNYLPNDILTKVDRASMFTSLETRAPFLDHRVFETAWRLKRDLKINSSHYNNSSKLILRKILYKYVPQNLIERPKSGFGIPLAKWMRGPLKEWISDLISKEAIEKKGFLDSDKVEKIWKEHLSGKFDNESKLWPIIMWQDWLNNCKF